MMKSMHKIIGVILSFHSINNKNIKNKESSLKEQSQNRQSYV